jgi:hypothetical protein
MADYVVVWGGAARCHDRGECKGRACDDRFSSSGFEDEASRRDEGHHEEEGRASSLGPGEPKQQESGEACSESREQPNGNLTRAIDFKGPQTQNQRAGQAMHQWVVSHHGFPWRILRSVPKTQRVVDREGGIAVPGEEQESGSHEDDDQPWCRKPCHNSSLSGSFAYEHGGNNRQAFPIYL